MVTKPTWLAKLRQQTENPPYLLKYRSSKWFIILTVSLSVFTDIFLYGVIVPVIPFALETRSHIGHERVQYWVSILIAVYGGSLLAFSPILGWIADQSTSRRSPLLFGLIALLAATVLLNVARSITVIALGRVLQGASAAVVWVVGLALLADTVDQKDIGQSMGYIGLAMSIGILIAPLLGGVVFDTGGYNAVFAMCYALIGLDIVLRLALVEKKVAQKWTSSNTGLDAVDNVTKPPSATAGKDEDKNPINGSPAPMNSSCSETNCQQSGQEGVDSTHLHRDPDPPIQRRHQLPPILFLLTSRRLLAALFGCLVQAILMTSFDSTLTIYVARTFSWSSTGAGLLFLPIVIPSFLGPFFGWLTDKYGTRYLATAGFVLACPFFVLLRFVTYNSLGQKVLLCAFLALIGLAMAMMMPPLMAEILYIANAKEEARPGLLGVTRGYAQAYALFNVAFAGGCLVGPIWAGFVNDKAGWKTMSWTLGLLSGLAAIPIFIWVGGLFYVARKTRPSAAA